MSAARVTRWQPPTRGGRPRPLTREKEKERGRAPQEIGARRKTKKKKTGGARCRDVLAPFTSACSTGPIAPALAFGWPDARRLGRPRPRTPSAPRLTLAFSIRTCAARAAASLAAITATGSGSVELIRVGGDRGAVPVYGMVFLAARLGGEKRKNERMTKAMSLFSPFCFGGVLVLPRTPLAPPPCPRQEGQFPPSPTRPHPKQAE